MKKNIVILVGIVAILLIAGMGFWKWKNYQKNNQDLQSKESVVLSGNSNTDYAAITLEEKIIIQLADKINNDEPLDKTHITIDQQIDHYIKGRVFFDFDSRKNGLFYATENEFYKSNDGSPVWGDMTVVFNEGYDAINCKIAKEYSFPESMINDCVSSNYGNFGTPDSSRWKLMGGDPKDTCSRVKYSGDVKISGWYEWRTNYVNKDWVLKVADKDMKKLLPSWLGFYKLDNVPDVLVSQLKNASKENPVDIIVKEINLYCEGLPWLNL